MVFIYLLSFFASEKLFVASSKYNESSEFVLSELVVGSSESSNPRNKKSENDLYLCSVFFI